MKIAKIEIKKAGEGYHVSYRIQDSKTVMGKPEPISAFDAVCEIVAQIREWEEQKEIKEIEAE